MTGRPTQGTAIVSEFVVLLSLERTEDTEEVLHAWLTASFFKPVHCSWQMRVYTFHSLLGDLQCMPLNVRKSIYN